MDHSPIIPLGETDNALELGEMAVLNHPIGLVDDQEPQSSYTRCELIILRTGRISDDSQFQA
jgi:hypothetical protein